MYDEVSRVLAAEGWRYAACLIAQKCEGKFEHFSSPPASKRVVGGQGWGPTAAAPTPGLRPSLAHTADPPHRFAGEGKEKNVWIREDHLMRLKIALAAAGLVGLAGSASGQDAYVIGVTAALTGPPASTYAPAMDALRIYLDGVNARGGVNGNRSSW